MPEVQIEIGTRVFSVACQDGEEQFLHAAAKMLDTEASVVLGQIGRMPPDRMLLMAGLMLADKTAALEDDLRELQDKIATQDRALRSAEERLADRGRKIADLQEAGASGSTAPAEVPEALSAGFADLAARAEAMAEAMEAATRNEAS
ncbi:cell division protein ZapA [Gymnodinialimonas ceratoperidinii]|uniref:Cell division protein ZapA n=1 Tax=Gymnodinialimonas ceratoperidinii TaxID=2856823 RepID=A0A8F6TTT6_9RHOB|nr:cell division protein ZapA [Gymnodinialimonas ceratoperidinii]QXT38831.1 cell division protein ZapA [Gymnodinialimonas ceratoperidinii]